MGILFVIVIVGVNTIQDFLIPLRQPYLFVRNDQLTIIVSLRKPEIS